MDNKEFQSIYERHVQKIYNYVLWMTRNRAACDDIVQSTFIKVWRSSVFPQPLNEQEALLFTIARRASLDFFRSNKRATEMRSDYANYQPTHAVNGAEDSLIWGMLEHLSLEEKSIVYLHIKIGYNYAEIGRILDLNETAVRVRACRAFKRLRKTYSKEEV